MRVLLSRFEMSTSCRQKSYCRQQEIRVVDDNIDQHSYGGNICAVHESVHGPSRPRPRRMIARSSMYLLRARDDQSAADPPNPSLTHVSSRLREAKKGNQTCDTPYPAPELFGSVFPFSSALSRPLFRSAPPSPNPCQPPLTRHGHSRPRSRCSSPSRAPATKRPNAGERIGSCGAEARVSPRKNAANVQTINALHVTRHAGASRARSCEIAARSRCTPWRMSKIAR